MIGKKEDNGSSENQANDNVMKINHGEEMKWRNIKRKYIMKMKWKWNEKRKGNERNVSQRKRKIMAKKLISIMAKKAKRKNNNNKEKKKNNKKK